MKTTVPKLCTAVNAGCSPPSPFQLDLKTLIKQMSSCHPRMSLQLQINDAELILWMLACMHILLVVVV